jgi:amino acid transporter
VTWPPLAWLTGKLRSKRPEPPDLTWQLQCVTLGAFVLAAFFTPWTYMALAVLIGLVIALMHALSLGKWVAVPVYAVVASIAVVLVILSLYTLWVPHEIVHFRPGTLPASTRPKDKRVGYVLSQDNGWITMLTSGAHQIVRYPDAAVLTQMVCERHPIPSHLWSEVKDAITLWDEVTSPANYLHPAGNQPCPY